MNRYVAGLSLVLLLTGCGALDTPGADKHEAWSVTLDQRFVDPHPAVAGGNFICFAYDETWPRDSDHRQGAGLFIAIGAATGRVVWKQPAKLVHDDTYSVDLLHGLILIGAGAVFYRGDDNAVHALDAATGKERWKSEKAGNLLGVHGGVVAMSDADYRLELRDAATGAIKSKRAEGNYGASALIDGDTLYLADDGVTAVSLPSGRELWHAKTNLKLKRVVDGMLIGAPPYPGDAVALRTSDGSTAWTFDGSLAGSHNGVLAFERMHVGPEYRTHKIDSKTGRELSEESQEQYKSDFQFHEDLTAGGVAFTVPYTDHYGYLYQRLHFYSPESISKDEWIEAHEPGGGRVYWHTGKLWGWVSDLVPSGNVVIRAETALSGGKARVRALRATRD